MLSAASRARALDRAAFAVLVISTLSLGFDRLDPSLGLTADLRLTNLRLVVALTIVLWMVARVASRTLPRTPRAIAVPVLVWLAVLMLSAWLAPAYAVQARAFVRDLALGVAFGWAAYDLCSTSLRQVAILRAFAVCGMAVGLIGLAEATGIRPIVDVLAGFRYQPTFVVGDLSRVASTLAHPNIAAMLLGLALPVQLVWIASATDARGRALLGLGALAELAALVLTISRAGVLSSLVVIALLLVLALRKHQVRVQRSALAACAGLVTLVGLALIARPAMLLHLQDETSASWYRAVYATPSALTGRPGEAEMVPVEVSNTGERAWLASGEHPFALSYHLRDADTGTSVNYDGLRTRLPADVPPGGAVQLQALLLAPPTPGSYVIEWDGVEESVTWFSWAGTPAGQTYLTVAGPPAPSASFAQRQAPTAPPPAIGSQPPVGRLMQWRIAVRMARNRPVLGVGPDNFRWVYGDFAEVKTWDTGAHANSLYFEWLADTGVLGLAAFVWFAWRLVMTGVRSVQQLDPLWLWRLGLLGSLAAWFSHGVLDYFYEPLPTNAAFWLVAALVLATAESRTKACGSAST